VTVGALPELWRGIASAIPSQHITGELLTQPFGVRLELARLTMAHQGRLRYLEVGVRLGHSLAFVAGAAELAGLELEALGVDGWGDTYAGEDNPGEDYVRGRLEELELGAGVTLVRANSHELLPELHGRRFDLIFVDGDHTAIGARRDLEDGWRLLEAGGVIVFDDIVTELGNAELLGVWREFVSSLEAGELAEVLEVLELPAGIPGYAWLRRRRSSP
jgi:hypothetical protein